MSATMNYYELLGLEKNARPEAIKAAYKRMAMVWHPDRNKAANASEMFMNIRKAYSVLMNKESRAKYDENFVSEADKYACNVELVRELVRMRREGSTKNEILKVCSASGLSAWEAIEIANLVWENSKPEAAKKGAAKEPAKNVRGESMIGNLFLGVLKFFAYSFGGLLGVLVAALGWVAYKVLYYPAKLLAWAIGGVVGLVMSVASLALVADLVALAVEVFGGVPAENFYFFRGFLFVVGTLVAHALGFDIKDALKEFLML